MQVHYFHQVDDPYSQLVAQVLPDLASTYDVDIVPHLVGPPPDEAAPERSKLEAFGRKDAAQVAPAYGLSLPDRQRPLSSELVALATRVLAGASAEQFLSIAATVGGALWTDDQTTLSRLVEENSASELDAAAAVAEGTSLRAKLGHYLGAMFYCAPEWYWGIDRLSHLEERLVQSGLRVAGRKPVVSRRGLAPLPDATPERRLQLEFYPSLRSPYSAISIGRVLDLEKRYPVDVVLRPVLPMVMRGLPVPLAKRIYIVLDTKREADRAGVDFGRVCDPVGEPVERGFSLYNFAKSQGRVGPYLQAFAEGVFAHGIDAGTDQGLQRIVEMAGLSWADAQQHRSDESWREELEANRKCLFDHGLWGVPSFRLIGAAGDAGAGASPSDSRASDFSTSDFSTWGQDRIWLVEEEIRRRLTE